MYLCVCIYDYKQQTTALRKFILLKAKTKRLKIRLLSTCLRGITKIIPVLFMSYYENLGINLSIHILTIIENE